MKILYGANNLYIDVTPMYAHHRVIYIPPGDEVRIAVYGDPCYGTTKHIRVTDDVGTTSVYNDTQQVLFARDEAGQCKQHQPIPWAAVKTSLIPPEVKLRYLHQHLQLVHGSLHEEYPEQLMSIAYIRPDDRVLELGGNVGRNSCVISAILNNSAHLTVVECCEAYAQQLKENRDANGMQFAIETAALSKRPLMQHGWDTVPVETAADIALLEPRGFQKVATLTWEELQTKYIPTDPKPFTVLVADCEGALYYILKDEPSFLTTFQTILIENDFKDADHKLYVDSEFQHAGFRPIYQAAGGWGPCFSRFYEVWKK